MVSELKHKRKKIVECPERTLSKQNTSILLNPAGGLNDEIISSSQCSEDTVTACVRNPIKTQHWAVHQFLVYKGVSLFKSCMMVTATVSNIGATDANEIFVES